jgi:flagellar protein FliS
MNTSLRNRFISDGAATVSQERLLIALYERLLQDMDQAAQAIEHKRPADAHAKLVHAQQILEELHMAIDVDAWPEGRRLVSLYLYVHEQLVLANLRKDAARVRECRELIEPLAETWREAYDQLTSRAVPVGAAAAAAGSFERGA